MSRYVLPHILKMEGYKPGEQPKDGRVIKLNTNENPYPPPPSVAEAARREAEKARLYPDPAATELRKAASEVYGFDPDWILAGNGSDELLTIIMRTFVGRNDFIAFPYPTYILYRTLAEIHGAPHRSVDLDENFQLTTKIAELDAKVVFLANPNSPTGVAAPIERIGEIAEKFEGRGVVVIDEAYVDFADGDCLSLARERENVIVLRTFSKSFSLAGLRVGLAFARSELIANMMKVKDSYNLNRVSIAGATAALRDIEVMRANVARIRRTRARLVKELTALGFDVLPSQANFVFARCGSADRARRFYEALKAKGVFIRYFPERRLDDGVRITVGTDEEIDALLSELKDLA